MGGFAISSWANGQVFAVRDAKKRKHYRTLSFLRDLRKGAFLQGIVRVGAASRFVGGDGFAHLRKRAIAEARRAAPREICDAEGIMSREVFRGWGARESSEPCEIRVSSDAIIEVHGTGLLRHVAWEGLAESGFVHRIEERAELAAPSGGDEYSRWLHRSAMRARRTGAWRAIAAYALFTAVAAAVVWLLLK